MSHKHVVIKALPITASIRKGGAKQVLAADRARIAKLVAGHSPHGPNVVHSKALKAHVRHKKPFSSGSAADSSSTSIDVTDAAVTYTMQVGVGSPATNYTLLYVPAYSYHLL